MQNQDTLRNLLLAGAIFILIMWVGPRLLFPPPPQPLPADVTSVQPEIPATPPTELTPGAVTSTPALTGGETGEFTVLEAEAERTIAMGHDDDVVVDRKEPAPPYRMSLRLSNIGASIETATTVDHAEKLEQPDRYRVLTATEGVDGRVYRSLAVEKVNIDGADVFLGDKRWTAGELTVSDEGQAVAFAIEILRGQTPVLRLTRTYRLPKQARESGRHDLFSNLTVANLSDTEHRVIVTYRGGVGVRGANPQREDRMVDYGVIEGDSPVLGHRVHIGSVQSGAKPVMPLFSPAPGDNQQRFVWAATANEYFTATVAPTTPAGEIAPTYLAEVGALDSDGSPVTTDDVSVRFVTRAATLPPGESVAYPAEVYIGEKEVDAMRKVPEYRARNYYYQISQSYGFCTFSWLVEMMIWLLNGLYKIVGDFGIAIVILVLIVRTLLHPITKKGQVNMVRMQQRMQELAPKIEEVKKKYANDKARLNQELMKLNLNPAGQMLTCLPMFIQMPIWVALYISLSNNILMRHEPFHGTWIRDLTQPDALIMFSSPFSLPLFGAIPSFNLLPLLVGITMYLQQKLQPKPKPSPNMTDQQRQQQEMMQRMGPIMSIMMFLIFYKMPSGLNLYVMASSFFGTIEQWRIRKHIRAHEEAGTLHGTVKKPEDTFMGRLKSNRPGWLEKLQKAAEEAQKLQSQRSAKDKPRR